MIRSHQDPRFNCCPEDLRGPRSGNDVIFQRTWAPIHALLVTTASRTFPFCALVSPPVKADVRPVHG